MSRSTDKTGADVVVERDDTRGAYTITPDGGPEAGRAFFVDRPEATPPERIFFHTEVDEEFGGRGLGTVLVREAVDATREAGLLVVPICPMVHAYLDKNAQAYEGAFRPVRPADLELAREHTQSHNRAEAQK